MQYKQNKQLVPFAKQLRKEMTKEERHLVIRIPNNEVSRNFRGVCAYVNAAVKQSLSQLC